MEMYKRRSESDESDEEERGFSSEEEEEELKQEPEEVSLEELQKARADGSRTSRPKPIPQRKLGRANKNRPMEMSSKKPVGRFREVVQAPKKVVRDPRFESLCGKLDTDGFRKRYNFFFEVELPAEKMKLQELIKKSKDSNNIEELKNHISWIDKQLKSGSSTNIDAKILAEHKKREKEAVEQGKRPFYLKKSEIRERRLVQKYNELKASGKLESFVEKRRRKNASKDHRYMPYRSPGDAKQQ